LCKVHFRPPHKKTASQFAPFSLWRWRAGPAVQEGHSRTQQGSNTLSKIRRLDRREDHGIQLYGSLGIDRSDPVRRLAQFKKNFEFFDAPVALFITIDRRLGPGQWADLGGYIHALAFLARGYGLDTCPQEAWARLYDTVGDFLKLPEHEMLFCGMAIGYGDRKHKANDFRSPRAELHGFCKFYGFD
jgi:nitroreductase